MGVTKKGSENLIYVFIWLIVYSLPVFTLRGDENFNWARIAFELFRILPFMLIFIVNNGLLVPQFLFRGKNIQYLIYISIYIIAIAFLFDYLRFIQDYIQPEQPPFLNDIPHMRPPPGIENHAPPKHNIGGLKSGVRLMDLIIISFLVVGFNTAVKFVFKRQEEEQNIEVQKKMHIQTELSFLKQQISPHFFMNTLNNIHALVDISSEEAKEAIIRLSGLMGYMLYESQIEKISIQKEMEFVKSYVELMKIRFTNEVDIKLNIPESLPKVSIPPLLTISLIENAFKHGVSYENNSFVHITFSFTDNKMCFEIKNPIHVKHEEKHNSGIGIINARNRLDLIYGNKFELLINQLPEKIFYVKLILPL
jgi:Histidine kinase